MKATETLTEEAVNMHIAGNLDEAKQKYIGILDAEPFNKVAHNNLGFLYTQKKMFNDAISEYNKAIAADENYFTAYKNLGITFMMMGRPDDSENVFQKAVLINENDESIYDNLAKLYFLKEQWHSSELYWKKSCEFSITEEKLIGIAQVLIKQGKFTDASNFLEMTIELNDENPVAHFLSGIISFESHNYGTSTKYLRYALGIEPENIEIRQYLALTMLRTNKLEEARLEFQRIISLQPGNIDALNNLVVLELMANQINLSLQYVNRVLEIESKNTKALYYKSLIYVHQKKENEAGMLLTQIIESNDMNYSEAARKLLASIM